MKKRNLKRLLAETKADKKTLAGQLHEVRMAVDKQYREHHTKRPPPGPGGRLEVAIRRLRQAGAGPQKIRMLPLTWRDITRRIFPFPADPPFLFRGIVVEVVDPDWWPSGQEFEIEVGTVRIEREAP